MKNADASPLFAADSSFASKDILIMTPNESSFRLLERTLMKLEGLELHWHTRVIDALADIFMLRPALIVVFGDTNQESLDFIQLVRNHADFRKTAIFVVLPENVKLKSRLRKKLNIMEVFETPIESGRLYTRTQTVLLAQSDKK